MITAGPSDYLGCISIDGNTAQAEVRDSVMDSCWCIGFCQAKNLSIAVTHDREYVK